ncbi:MAG: type 1 glutamine amidotransferase domain-containing protein [Alteromonadaceae bacterium]|nr:type 1 glutamine amidotransferase domain-containing protein [Alteromonadaceae bacterium]
MRKLCFLCVFTLLTLYPAQASQRETSTTRILMLISGYGTEAQPELSYDLEELAQAYLVLHDNSVEIDIATPKGGPVLVKANKDNLSYIQRFKSLALEQLRNTLTVKSIEPSHYQAVFIVGGAGAMFDLPGDTATQTMLTSFAAQQKIIAAVCHGPAAIADIKLPDGQYLIAGKQVNAFTNVEERAFSGEHIAMFPFLVEDKLIANGGVFIHNDPMLPFVAIDDNLITAQNPSSVPVAAEALLLKLGITPTPRKAFKDEATMQLLATAKQTGVTAIDLAMAKNPDNYDVNYLALYGFYAYALASEQNKERELDLMLAIAKHFKHPAYDAALIKALHERNQIEQARLQLTAFTQRYPGNDTVKELTKLLNLNTIE